MISLAGILIVTPHYPPRRLGGTELRAHKLATWLSTHGHYVEVVCVEQVTPGRAEGLRLERDVYGGIPVHRLHLSRSRSLTDFRYTYEDPEVARYLDSVICGHRPDVIHLISGYLITAGVIRVARARGIPLVVTLTDYWFLCPRINLIRSNRSTTNVWRPAVRRMSRSSTIQTTSK